uniref:Protein phosphatase 2c n=2 Tax=Rhizophora mucronata TaxID=61149 RepID=A0A2P2LAY7_RHIMU
MIAEPSILIRELRPHDLFLIFASDGLWEHLSDEAAVDLVFRNPRTGIAKRLVRAALREAAKKREMRYSDIKNIERGVRRHFHDDITVVVIYLDHEKNTSNGRSKYGAIGCISAPVDIFSINTDQAEKDLLPAVF